MLRVGGVVLCGGQSSRMGRPKAWLPFGDELMLPRVVRLLGEVVAPVIVVAAPGQDVPPLPAGVAIVHDPEQGRGPLQGLAAGLEALRGRADAAYLSSCDVPFLRPALVRRLIELLGDNVVCVPEVGGYHHPLAAVYRIESGAAAARLLAEGRLRPAFLFDEVPTRIVRPEELADVDPTFESLRNLNAPAEYEAALRDLHRSTEGHVMSTSPLSCEYELYVPLSYNDGEPVEAEKLDRLRRRLVDHFGGLTDTRQRSEGQWRVGGVTFRDEIVIFRLLAGDDAVPFLRALKEEMKCEFRQDDVLIVARRVEIL